MNCIMKEKDKNINSGGRKITSPDTARSVLFTDVPDSPDTSEFDVTALIEHFIPTWAKLVKLVANARLGAYKFR